jgi:hypothetical protein
MVKFCIDCFDTIHSHDPYFKEPGENYLNFHLSHKYSGKNAEGSFDVEQRAIVASILQEFYKIWSPCNDAKLSNLLRLLEREPNVFHYIYECKK